jgi:hypothetical protein
MSRRIARWSFLLLPCLVAPALAEDPEAPSRTSAALDVAAWRLPAAARGAVLLAPSDLGRSPVVFAPWEELDGRFGALGEGTDVWVPFEPGTDETPHDHAWVTDLLHGLAALAEDDVELTTEGDRLRVVGTRDVVRRTSERLAWAEATFLPRLVVEGLLVAGPDRSVLASARVGLVPGRWARAWLQRSQPVFPVDWDIEIAQEVTAVRPLLTTLAEGQELYLRWLPGESVDLLEVWQGDLEHLEEVVIDFTPLRNVPESSGLGPVRIPRTALRRAYTTLRLPDEGPIRMTWRAREGERSLSLRRVAKRGGPASQAYGEVRAGALRLGALAAPLLFDGRDELTEQVHRDLFVAAEPDGDVELRTLPGLGSALTLLRAKSAVETKLRERVAQAEEALVSARLTLRAFEVPEESVRAALSDGRLAVGQAPEPELLASLARAGTPEASAVDLPLLAGVMSGFRVGASVPGLVRLDVEVAQQAGGMDPVMGARFAGLQGEVRWRPLERGAALSLEATWAWADAQGGRTDLTFRPPVGMDFNKDRVQAEPDAVRRVSLPTLTGGSADVEGELVFEGEEERVAGVVVRDGEVVLLLARLVR